MMASLIALICPAGTCVEERYAEQVLVNGVEEVITKGKCFEKIFILYVKLLGGFQIA